MAEEAVPPLAGKLGKGVVPLLLARLYDEGRDGCLTVTRGTVTRRLFLRDGMIVSGSSNEPQDRLGEILIAQGKLTRADHRRYWELAKAEGRRLGQTLVVNDRITTTDLYQGVAAQVTTILDRIQKWPSGDYAFEEGVGPEPGSVLLRIPLALYLRAEARPKAPARRRPVKAAAAEGEAGSARTEKGAKGGARGKRKGAGKPGAPPAAEEPSAAPPPADEADEELSIEVEEPAGAEAPAAAPAGAAARTEASTHAAAEAAVPDGEAAPAAGDFAPATVAEQAEEDRAGEICFLVQDLKKREGQEPQAILGVAADADRPAIREAYLRIAALLDAAKLPKEVPPEVAAGAVEALAGVTAAYRKLDQAAARRQKAPVPTGASHPAFRDPEAAAAEEAQAAYQQAREYINRGNYWQATQSMRQAVRLRPREAAYRQFLGLSLLQVRRLHEAAEQLREAVVLEPRNAAHHVNLGRVYRAGHLYRKAREAFELAVRFDPHNAQAREELADLPEEQPPKAGGSILKKIFGK